MAMPTFDNPTVESGMKVGVDPNATVGYSPAELNLSAFK